MKLVLPKSVQESQRFVAWGFPALIGYGIVSIPSAVDTSGVIAVCVGVVVVLTGWLSFGIIREEQYNDVLLATDLSLLSVYFLLLYYGHLLTDSLNDQYATVW